MPCSGSVPTDFMSRESGILQLLKLNPHSNMTLRVRGVYGEAEQQHTAVSTRAAEPVLAAVGAEEKGLCGGQPMAQPPPFPPCRPELVVTLLSCPAAAWRFSRRLRSTLVVCALSGVDRGKLG